MSRPVLIWIDDDVTEVGIRPYVDSPEGRACINSFTVPVPEDDQLREALELACRALEMYSDFAWGAGQTIEGDKARALLRAAFGLDQEDET